MTEIRPVRESEADAFLEVMCDVFSLDLGRARSIFFAEPMYDLRRKWAVFEGRRILSILTTCPLEFGWGKAYGIAGVATVKNRQREGLASKLLDRVFSEATRMGEGASLLFAKDTSLYERNGFQMIDRVIRAPIATSAEPEHVPGLESDEVRPLYDAWASRHPDRLRRDEQRWRYWLWHYRISTRFQHGYLCAEPGVLREAVFSNREAALPLPKQTEWFGTAHMTRLLEIPLAAEPRTELYLMARNVPGIPQMFMTDQF